MLQVVSFRSEPVQGGIVGPATAEQANDPASKFQFLCLTRLTPGAVWHGPR